MNHLALAGSLNFLGHGVFSQASYNEIHLQWAVGCLTVAHLFTANTVLQDLKSLSPKPMFSSASDLGNPSYLELSDASQGSGSYWHTEYILGIYLPVGRGSFIFPFAGTARRNDTIHFRPSMLRF